MSGDGDNCDGAVLVTTASIELRRSLGVTAWAVLEVLVLDAVVTGDGDLSAATNVRRIASRLGISKDTAAAALARLGRRGLVERQPPDRTSGGRFGRSVYVIRLDGTVGLGRLDPGVVLRRKDGSRLGGASVTERTEPVRSEGRPAAPASGRRRSSGDLRAGQRPLFDLGDEPD